MALQSTHPYPAESVKVVRVSGSDRDMGRQHAEQVGPVILQGMTSFYYQFWQRMVKNDPEAFLDRQAFRVVRFLLEKMLVPKLMGSIPTGAKDRIAGMAEALKAPYDEMIIALVLPDLMPLIQAYLTVLRPSLFIEAGPAPRFGCSSFISNGRQFLHGRNLDFPGVAYWDRYPVVQVTSPPNRLKFVSFASAGVPFGGITGINEAQVSVSLHQHYCRKTSFKGRLPFFIAEEILGKARTIDEAVAFLGTCRVATAWAFVLSDGKSRRAAVYECHPRARGVTWIDEGTNCLAHSNFFQTRECQPSEYATTAKMNWDNYWRKRRLEDRVKAIGKDLTPADACQIISDHFDPYWGEEKYVNRTVSQVYNIQSVVFDPVEMQAWSAEGNAPIHLGKFRKFDLGELLAGRNGVTEEFLPSYTFTRPAVRDAKQSYILSFIAGFDGRFEEAQLHLKRTLALDFCAEAALVGAVLHLKAREYQDAIDLLERAREWVETRKRERGLAHFPPEYFEVCLFLARAYDLKGDRTKALSWYREVSSHADLDDGNVRALAKEEGPYTPTKLGRILMPYATYIPFE